jgi:hypothetical protein
MVKHLFGAVGVVVDVALRDCYVVAEAVVVFALHQIVLVSSEALESLFFQLLEEAYWCQR